MANRKRNIQLKIWVTEEERKLIEYKMSLVPTRQIGAYIRKMAIDGYVIHTDTTNIKAMNKELRAIGRNINQIAKRVNSTGDIYRKDIAELRKGSARYGGYKEPSYQRYAEKGSCIYLQPG